MKTASDPRHQNRRHVVQELYSYFLNKEAPLLVQESKSVIANLEKIDQEIIKNAPEWPLNNINKIDLAILRLGTYEILFRNDVSASVAIDEAVELGKEFGSEDTSSFVNAVLAKIMTNFNLKNHAKLN